jgi:membrane peptidoglycan carboxypeptidase
VPFADISPHLINSIMTTEDSGFFKHHGFIPSEFRSALQQNLQRGYFRLGASSITMQTVKNVLLSREKTLSRKLQELFLTWYIEHQLTKERIMEIYFNVIEFGPGIYGIGRAARHYFGKSAKELEPQEAAWFSSILPNPKRRYVQYCHATGTLDAKWDAYVKRIMRRMHERGRLTDEEYERALATPFKFARGEAMGEKECMAMVKRITTPLEQLALQPVPGK